MTPIRFGAAHRELVGYYHPPEQNLAQRPAVLICNPFGPEAIRAYRVLRLFADRLARAGCPVLRFDYFGTGDSSGEDETASLVGWAGDIGTAHRELIARSGKSSVAWLGVRLGASMCALAAQSLRTPLSSLVLWDPIISGLAYLQFLAGGPEQPDEGSLAKFDIGALIEVLGFALPDGFKNELLGFSLPSAHPNASHCTVILSSETATSRRWHEQLTAANARMDWCVSDTDAGWTSDKAMNTGAIPAGVLRVVESKLLEPAT